MALADTPRLSITQVELELAHKPETISEARHALDRLAGFLPSTKLEDVRLVVSELVTNSVLHAGLSPDDRISLSVVVSAGSVRGRVCDPGLGFEKPSKLSPRHDLRGGWGLPIVERISDRWGVEKDGHVCVWFEID
jgi:anti-sigma regulatory factor (Ser/Thr protein kinase)